MTPQHPARTPYWLLVLFVALASAIAGLAYRYHLAQKDAVAHEVGNQLLAIADMKVKHISAWRSEKLGEGRMVLQSRFTLEAVQRTVAGRSSAAEKAFVTAWLDALCGELHYAGVTLTDSQGNTVLSRGRVF